MWPGPGPLPTPPVSAPGATLLTCGRNSHGEQSRGLVPSGFRLSWAGRALGTGGEPWALDSAVATTLSPPSFWARGVEAETWGHTALG